MEAMSNRNPTTNRNEPMEKADADTVPAEVKRLVEVLLMTARALGCNCDPSVRVGLESYVAHDDWCAVWTGGSSVPVRESSPRFGEEIGMAGYYSEVAEGLRKLREEGCTCHPFLATTMVPYIVEGERVPIVKVLGHEAQCAMNVERN